MKSKIIAILGMCGSGKSVACEYFTELGMQGVYFGGRTMEELVRQGLEVTPDNERKVREELRVKHGMAAFAHLSIDKIKEAAQVGEQNEQGFTFIDGLYSFEEYEVLEAAFPNAITMIEIFTDKKIRYERLAQRSKRSLTAEQARNRDLSEIRSLNKGGPIAFSDYKVVNNGSVEALRAELAELLKKLV